MYEQGAVALRDVSFHLEKGGFAFLTGPSGAGKTTLLKMIYREERPSEGSVEVAEKETGRLAVGQVQRLRRRIGIVFQDGRLIASRDVFENVTFVLRAQGLAPRARKERALNVLRQVGLSHRMRSLPRQLSGGEQQRVRCRWRSWKSSGGFTAGGPRFSSPPMIRFCCASTAAGCSTWKAVA